jgi:CDP-diacylglycerol--glycerol-3-phosphate 3-phosphatidyltransferase
MKNGDPMKRSGFWNLPNTLTVLRIAAVPFMVWVLWTPPGVWMARLAMTIFVTAMVTDIIDGYLARKWGLVSVVGAFLDPLADKLMVVTTLVMLVAHGWLPAWMVALLICRELTITALRTIALSEGLVLAASTLGKFKTSFQATALGFLLWHHETIFLGLFPVDVHACGIILMYFALFFSLVSGWSYLNSFFRHAGNLNAA